MAKANGEGSIQKHGDGWRLRWTMPDGRRKSRVIGKMSPRAADAVLRDIITDVNRGVFADERAGMVRFADFAQQCLELWEPTDALATFKNRESQLRVHLLPTFGHWMLKDITRRHVDLWWARKAAQPVVRRNSYFLLKKMFDLAVDWELIKVSPCRVKDAGKDVSKMRPDFTVTDLDLVLSHVAPFYRAPLEVLFASHVRLGELVALNGSDYRDGRISVTKQKTGQGLTTSTKTDQFKTIKLLERGITAMDERPRVIGDTPLFAGERGRRITRLALRNAWNAAREAAGFPEMHLHDVRHIGLSLVAEVAPPHIVQQRAGHASPTSTRRYLHASQRQHEETVEKVDDLIRRIS